MHAIVTPNEPGWFPWTFEAERGPRGEYAVTVTLAGEPHDTTVYVTADEVRDMITALKAVLGEA
jgi:hypothetical protein